MFVDPLRRLAAPATLIALATGLLVAGPTAPRVAHAEGSANTIANGGYRPFMEYRNDFTVGGLVRRRTVVKVYAAAGETLLLASSANGVGAGRINWRAPDGSNGTAPTTAGIIANRAEEVAGPLPNAGGYAAFAQVVGAGQTGVWEIDFVSPDPNSGQSPPPTLASANWPQGAFGYVSAWDVTVRAASGTAIPGRAFIHQLAANMGNLGFGMNSRFWLQTRDGFRYRVDANGVQPFGFNFFANNKGFRASSTAPIYRSVDVNLAIVQSPDAPDTPGDVTHKLFFDVPAADLPASAPTPGGSTWLVLGAPFIPTVTNFRFVGADGRVGQAGSGIGGTFRFDSDGNGTYTITIDVNGNTVYTDPVDRVLIGNAGTGANVVSWDGRDGFGAPAQPSGTPSTVNATVSIASAEVHFPYLDAETNPNGIILERLNGPGAPDARVFYDDRALGGSAALPPTGQNSLAGAHVWPVNFGDNRGMDTWSLLPGVNVSLSASLVIRLADVELASKTHAPEPLLQTQPMTYTIVVRNNGPDSALGVTMRDTMPAGLNAVALASATPTGGASLVSESANGAVRTALLDMPPGSTMTFAYTATVDAGATGPIINRALALRGGDAGDLDDPNRTGAGNNSRRDTATVQPYVPELSIDKRHTAAFSVGSPGTYRLVVNNKGTAPTAGTITVRDTLPTGLTYSSASGAGWTIVHAAGIVTATHPGPLVPNDSLSFQLTVVPGAAALPSVVNAAEVSGGGDVSPEDNYDRDPTDVGDVPDLTLDKRHTANFTAGQSGVWSFVVTNVGGLASSGTITVRDTLPSGVTFISGAAAPWSVSAAAGVVTATYPNAIAPGDSASFTLTVLVGDAAVPQVVNRATVSGGGDASPGNNDDTDLTPITGVPNVTLDKRHTADFVAGTNGLWTLVVRNVGSAASAGTITVLDTLPAGVTFVSGAAAPWNVSATAGVVTATYPNAIAAGDSAKFTLTVAVAPAAIPGVTNSAVVSGGGDVSPGDNRDVDPTPVSGTPDLTLDKRHTANFTVGSNGAWTFVVRNIGPGSSAGVVTVRDTLPPGVTFVSAAAAPWTFSQAANVITANYPNPIASGDSTSFSMTVLVNGAAFPAETNTATLSGGGDTTPGNNRDSDTVPVAGVPDLTIDKRHTANFDVGAPGNYRIVVTNVGAAAASGTITVRDTLPAGLAYTSATGAGWSFGVSGAVVTATHPGPLAVNDSLAFTLQVSVGIPAAPSVTNAATVSGGGDASPANNRDADLTAVGAQPELSLEKSHSGTLLVGRAATYTLVARNLGTAPTAGTITVRDTLPATLAFASAAGAGWTIVENAGVVVATRSAAIAPSDSIRFTITVNVDLSAIPQVTNAATLSGGGDLTPGNNRAVDVAPVSAPVDLAISKAHVENFEPGAQETWLIGVTNLGGIATSGTITVRDTLPAGAQYVSASGAGWNFSYSAPVLTATYPAPLGSGGQLLISVQVLITATAPDTLVNTATVNSPDDQSPANNRAIDSAPLGQPGPLVVDKRASTSEAEIGDVVTYTVTIRNQGTVALDHVMVHDFLPPGLRYVDGTARLDGRLLPDPIGSPGPSLSFAIGTVASVPRSLEYRVQVGAGAGSGPGTNVAVATDSLTSPGGVRSNVAGATITIRPGVFGDEGILAGKVFLDGDCDRDGVQGPEEPGIPGVRLWLEDGTAAITDAEGKYSFQHVRPRTHLVRVDAGTLPAGARMRALTNRHTRDGLMATADVTKGEYVFVNFAEGSRDSTVRRVVKQRRELGEAATEAALPAAAGRFVLLGLLEGRVDFRKLSVGSLGGAARDRFEDELRDASFESDRGRTQGAGRGALFAKGTVGDDWRVTLRYDSERAAEARRFRDLRPQEGYDVLGDASAHAWDAPSTSRLYARVDRGASYAMFGDFATPVRPARLLSAYTRRLNGGAAHATSGWISASGWGTQARERQVVDELPGLGLSGPYALSRTDGVIGTETVEILVRDRVQPARILSRATRVRFADYTLEPLTGRLLFRQPVPSVDAELNPVSVRVAYEIEGVGDAYGIYGGEVTLTPTKRLEAGFSAARDEDPLRPRAIAGAHASFEPGEALSLRAEVAHSDSGGELFAGRVTAEAWRGELAAQHEGFSLRAHAQQTDIGFDNPSSGVFPGRRELGAEARLASDDGTSVFGRALRTENLANGAKLDGAEAGLGQRIGPLSAELAYRWAEGEGDTLLTARPANMVSALRGRLSSPLPGATRGTWFAEYEQDIDLMDQNRWALGGDLRLTERARLTVRHEQSTSFAGPYALNAFQEQSRTVIGLAGDALREGHVFSEYRARDAFHGRDAQAAFGLRNRWQVAPGMRLDASFERLEPIRGGGVTTSSLTSGLEWTRDPRWKGTARAEYRIAGDDQLLLSAGAARKLSRDWTGLARTQWLTSPKADRASERTALGVAWRQTDRDAWNALMRYEHRQDKAGGLQGPESEAHVVSGHVNWHPTARWHWSGQSAAKWRRDEVGGIAVHSDAALFGTRVIVDLTRRFDAGLTSRGLFSNGFAVRRYGAGAELGARLTDPLRLAAGYNLFGFVDADIAGSDRTDPGPYVKLGLTFDESWFGNAAPKGGAGR